VIHFTDQVSFQKISSRTVAKDSCCGEIRRKKGGEGIAEGKGKEGEESRYYVF